MGLLTLAKSIADNPKGYSITQLIDAYAYLEKTQKNGGLRNSERATARLARRLKAIAAEVRERT